jgi:hypothetical protein
MVAKRQDADSPWKTILRGYLPDAVDFFFPAVAKLIDWTSTPVFLDKEFERLSPQGAIGKRYADQLVKVKLKRGKSLILLLHIEVQGSKEKNFEERMLIYAMRIYDRFKQLPCSLAILCDSNANWRPQQCSLATPGSKLDFEFTAAKLLDYKAQWDALAANPNPFAIVVMAHLKAQETRNRAKERKNWKFWLVRSLYEKGYNRGQVLDLFKFLDCILGLPAGLDNSFWKDLKTYEAEKQMTYITSVEKIGFKRGQEAGLQKGIQTGKQEVAMSMLEEGMAVETIARITKLSIEQIQALQA